MSNKPVMWSEARLEETVAKLLLLFKHANVVGSIDACMGAFHDGTVRGDSH